VNHKDKILDHIKAFVYSIITVKFDPNFGNGNYRDSYLTEKSLVKIDQDSAKCCDVLKVLLDQAECLICNHIVPLPGK
jgi:hypothetical protein